MVVLVTVILLWNFGFLGRYNYLTAKWDIAKGNPKVVLIGLPNAWEAELNVINQQYGFTLVTYGCLVNYGDENGIAMYNRQTNNYLTKVNGAHWKIRYQKKIDSLVRRLVAKVPETAFWIGNNGKGNYFEINRLHSHKNSALVTIYDASGTLVCKERFMMVCPASDLQFIEDLEKEIDFYDGQNIRLKGSCFLLPQ